MTDLETTVPKGAYFVPRCKDPHKLKTPPPRDLLWNGWSIREPRVITDIRWSADHSRKLVHSKGMVSGRAKPPVMLPRLTNTEGFLSWPQEYRIISEETWRTGEGARVLKLFGVTV